MTNIANLILSEAEQALSKQENFRMMGDEAGVIICLEQIRRDSDVEGESLRTLRKRTVLTSDTVKVKIPKLIKRIRSNDEMRYEFLYPVKGGNVQVVLKSAKRKEALEGIEITAKVVMYQLDWSDGSAEIVLSLEEAPQSETNKILRVWNNTNVRSTANKEVFFLPSPLEGTIVLLNQAHDAEIVELFKRKETI